MQMNNPLSLLIRVWDGPKKHEGQGMLLKRSERRLFHSADAAFSDDGRTLDISRHISLCLE
ncbi:hypothetical protein SAY86_024341 [Trapa natans]|uniref:Uncharacterized protein n=1 Tax=Trapa natans TaxID=22666 RepID=A0AAN7RHX1_TRANT|nr:hypothetical protein SAY86_024341 [Trapa natans]